MSKGLGRVERAILITIAWVEPETEYWSRDLLLAAVVNLADDRADYRPTRAEREALNRAVRSLIRKGLLEQLTFPPVLIATPEALALGPHLAARTAARAGRERQS